MMKDGASRRSNQNRWIWISGIAFLLSISASAVLVIFGKRLQDLGIIGNIYYIILIPLGFSSAAFLAGAMKSYASFKSNGTIPYGELNLTGPIVIFVLVVGGGFILPTFNKKGKFDLKMRIVSDDKPAKLFNEGSVILYIGKYTRQENIHNSEVIFPDIPEGYHNKKGSVSPTIDNYQLADLGEVVISENEDSVNNINVIRTKQSLSTNVRGSIVNEKRIAVKNAFIDFGSGLATAYTNESGDFSVAVPLPAGEKVHLRILVYGISRFNEDVTISSTTPINLKVDLTP